MYIPMMRWFQDRKSRKEAAARLYDTVVAQSRLPVFYDRFGIADTIDGRFDLIILHVFLMVNRMGQLGPGGRKLSQALFDRMFKTMEPSLREMGIGDLGIPKHMKKMMKAFNGRLHVYHDAFESGADLQSAIARNIYRTDTLSNDSAEMTRYALASRDAFAGLALNDFLNGAVSFPDIAFEYREAARA